MEVFKIIPGYEGHYEISNTGIVRSIKKKPYKVIKPVLSKYGYLKVTLSSGTIKSRKTHLVHRLVAMTFIDNSLFTSNLVVNHINFNKRDNSLKNLEIVPHRVNGNKKHLESTSKYTGVYWSNSCKKYKGQISIQNKQIYLGCSEDEEYVNKICEKAYENIELFDGDASKFRQLVTRLAFPKAKIIPRLKKEEVIEIKKLLRDSDLSLANLANMFGVTRWCISDIKINKSWKNLNI